MSDQHEKFEQFKALHMGEGSFVMPNPWDAGSARLLQSIGFQALATTSAGYAFASGKRDSEAGLSRREVLDNAAEIVLATPLPVSADLEDGFGAAPEDCNETIRQAIGVGLVGGSIEDATGKASDPLFSLDLATDRVRAAAEACRGQPFLLTARAEGFLWGRHDLDDVIRRLQAFSEAGADVLYAPGLPDLASIETLCREVDKPVNVVMGLKEPFFAVSELAAVGVRRVSVGGSFARAAFGAVRRAALEVFEQGTFGYAHDAMPGAEIAALMSDTHKTERT
ncbi:2-Methylisocitrate lyase, PEP mutase family [Shimia gijangensis]|uniref:2-Methylisocitrate lyase, PEP mutase family n=1 Tax=Shimia gijangensis TaxID=1470563 RepID=A0A1M6G1G5_9RHOB|nr:isocitrate lyase/phosphoenolpyruvate mutase family protein [Shimia gijangensis]SHJ03790.1 2-Methylisocitrate lyase, PEP mutase family [Shimia gijangensis]